MHVAVLLYRLDELTLYSRHSFLQTGLREHIEKKI